MAMELHTTGAIKLIFTILPLLSLITAASTETEACNTEDETGFMQSKLPKSDMRATEENMLKRRSDSDLIDISVYNVSLAHSVRSTGPRLHESTGPLELQGRLGFISTFQPILGEGVFVDGNKTRAAATAVLTMKKILPASASNCPLCLGGSEPSLCCFMWYNGSELLLTEDSIVPQPSLILKVKIGKDNFMDKELLSFMMGLPITVSFRLMLQDALAAEGVWARSDLLRVGASASASPRPRRASTRRTGVQ